MTISEFPEIVEFTDTYGVYCVKSDIFQTFLRWVGWWLIQLLKMLVDTCDRLLTVCYSLIDYLFSDPVLEFINSFRPVLWVLFAVALFILGYLLITNKAEVKGNRLMQNICLTVLVLTTMPFMVQSISEITMAATDYVRFNDGESISDTLIRDNIVDLRYLDSKDWNDAVLINQETGGLNRPGVSLSLPIDQISPGDVVHCDDSTLHNQDFFRYYITYDADGNRNEQLSEVYWNSMFSFIDNTYYRYYIDFLPIFVSLISMALALLFSAFKVGRIIFDLAVHEFLAVIFAASDFTSGQRLKQVLKSMGGMFFTLFCSAVIIKFYMVMNVYIKTLPLDPWVQSFILLIMAFAVIDGPNIIERCIGVDVGLTSVFRTTASIFAGSRAAGHMAKAAVGSIGKVGSAVDATAKGASYGLGRWIGGLDYKQSRQEKQSDPPEAPTAAHQENANVNRDIGSMNEEKRKTPGNVQTSQSGTSSAPEESGAVESRTLGGLGKSETTGNSSPPETDQKASVPLHEVSETSENSPSAIPADSQNPRELDGTGGNNQKESPDFAQQELEREKSDFSSSASPNKYFPNTSVTKTRDGLNHGNNVTTPYSSAEGSDRITSKSVSLPYQFPGSNRQPRTIAENYRAGYATGVQKAEKRELRRQQREERRQEKKENHFK